MVGDTIRKPGRFLVLAGLLFVLGCDVGGPPDEVRDAFLTRMLTALSVDWNPASLKGYATEEAYAVFMAPEQETMFTVFRSLGPFQSLESTTTTGWKTTTRQGTTIETQSQATFENGAATVTTTLQYEDGRLRLLYLHISAPLFMELMRRGAESI